MQTWQMQSCVHENGTIENAFFEVEVREPGPDEVTLKIEAAPVNPSDLGLMFGPADAAQASASTRNGQTSIVAPLSAPAMRAFANRVGEWLPVGNEASGTVVAAGSSPAAQALMGKRVGAFGGEMYTGYRTLSVAQCLPLVDGTSAEEGASCFVNPMTALGFVETMKMEGHTAIVHCAAASNLGQMLNRICLADGIPLVNIVRSAEQKALLTEQGAQWVLDSSEPDFMSALEAAISATGATLGFDPIGGGQLTNQILVAMEAAAVKRMTAFSRYGSEEHKQVYIYGALDMSPTSLGRGYGFAWGVGGWLLTPFMKRAGGERVGAMMHRVASELTTTFASHYSDRVSLLNALDLAAAQKYGRRATGQKTLICGE